jgi:hypothetical protein
MSNELLNLIISVAFSFLYLAAAMFVLNPFFDKISKPKTQASGLLFVGVMFGFGLTLYHFSDISTSALYYYSSQHKLLTGIWYSVLFGVMAFVFSLIVFHITYYLIGSITHENEKAELARNNFYIAALHAAIFILICIIVTKPLTDLANTMVSYPKFSN